MSARGRLRANSGENPGPSGLICRLEAEVPLSAGVRRRRRGQGRLPLGEVIGEEAGFPFVVLDDAAADKVAQEPVNSLPVRGWPSPWLQPSPFPSTRSRTSPHQRPQSSML
jgi:hypothetical protein